MLGREESRESPFCGLGNYGARVPRFGRPSTLHTAWTGQQAEKKPKHGSTSDVSSHSGTMSLKSFTPVSGLFGGSLIGLSAATLLLFNGDILGASGLMSSFVTTPVRTLTDPSQLWKLAFLASFCVTTRLYLTMIDPDALKDERLGNSSILPIVSP